MWDDFSMMCNIDDYGERFRELYRRIREHGNDLVKQTIGYVEDRDAYPQDRDEILGYVLGARCAVDFTNAEADFALPSPKCSRESQRVKDGLPLLLKSKPKGLLAYVGEELIFHSDLLKVIRERGFEGVGQVMLQKATVSDWHRMNVHHVESVLDPASWQKGFCVRCGSPCTWPTALWFAKGDVPLEEPAFNEVGMDHFSKRDVVVVPKSLHEKLVGKGKRLQYKGVLFHPLYSKKSSRFKVVSLINELTAHLPTAPEVAC
jgi:hypothetical protein